MVRDRAVNLDGGWDMTKSEAKAQGVAVSGVLAFRGADKVEVRVAISRDAEMVIGYIAKARLELNALEARLQRNLMKLGEGVSAGDICTFGADALDDVMGRIARRVDHMNALVEVAYWCE